MKILCDVFVEWGVVVRILGMILLATFFPLVADGMVPHKLRWIDLSNLQYDFRLIESCQFNAIKVGLKGKEIMSELDISKWMHIQALDLSFSEIDKIPDWISCLVNLRYLDLTCNTLSNAVSFRFPSSLEILFLDGCGLTEVPQFLSKAANLRFLGLSFNDCRMDLPKWLASRQKDKKIKIRGLCLEDFD